MLTCRDVTRIVASGELEHAGPWRGFLVRIHHLMCALCRRYASQIRAISREAQVSRASDEFPGEREALERLRRRLLGPPPRSSQ